MRAALIITFSLAAAIAVLILTGCIRYYRWERQEENPGRADVLIVLGLKLTKDGKASFILHNRVAMAKYLLDEGYAERAVFTGGNPQSGVTEAKKMVSIAVDLGVDREKITLEERARTTTENAKYSADLMVESGWKSAMIVSDAAHLGYALPVFRDVFEEKGLTLYWLPVKYELLGKLGVGKRSGDPPE